MNSSNQTPGDGRTSAEPVSRRRLLKGATGAAVAAALGAGLGHAKLGSGSSTTTAPPTPTPSKRVHQWTMIIDLRKCDGCVTIDTPPQCMEACKKGHFVPDGQQWIQVYEVEDKGGGKFFMPTPCFQCENSPCLHVCPVGATFQNEEGIVLIDQNRCIGCRFCMAACPYSRRFFNWGDPDLPPAAYFAEYSPEFPVPAKKGTVIKCVMCAHRLRDGKLPHCVEGCPMGAIYLGDLVEDRATNGQETVTISKFLSENGAYRYKEELGTKPRVFYIPGHGQEFERTPADEREMKPVPSWQEIEAQPAEPTPSPAPGASGPISRHQHEGS